jgi:4-amino-4-deoxy-L-arabinose transferase-like glycosyltransferase
MGPMNNIPRVRTAHGAADARDVVSPVTAAAGPAGRVRRVLRGPDADPRWARPALLALLAATLVLYVWDLSASGWANSFYSAAVQAGATDWTAFFFGSSDAANSITVDKPPLALWPMALSVRIFGLSAWSILVPQALMGVASVGVLYTTVKRWFGAGAGLIAGVVLATTPVAALMFRFNNPDALLVLLMVGAAWTALRAVQDGRTRWVVATGALVGLGFLTKQLQVLLVVPGFALALLVAGQGSVWRRLRDLVVAGVSMVAAAGWWLVVVELWPADARPYIGGSQHNSILELTLGYNGLGRLTGEEVGSVGGGVGGNAGGNWGVTGITRMFDGQIGGQIAWLLPAALVAVLAGLWWTRRAPRDDLRRASVIVWGAWLLVTALVFSFMAGIFHEYYTVALAPAVGALVGIGASMAWSRREQLATRVLMAVVVAGSSAWAAVLLGRSADWNPWLAPLVLVAGGLASVGLVATCGADGPPLRRRIGPAAVALAAVAVLAGPVAYSVQTAMTPHSGSIVTAGPAVSGGMGGPGGGAPGGFGPGGGLPGGTPPTGMPTGTPPAGMPTGGPPAGAMPTGGPPMGAMGDMDDVGGMGGMGGLLRGTDPSDELVEALMEDAEDFTWIAAAVGSNNASGYQLATEEPVMAVGGFNGSDPSPTLEEFQQYVEQGEIHWFIAGGMGGGMIGGMGGGSQGGSSSSSEISDWVTSTFTEVTVDGTTMYDLTQPS